MFKAKITYRSKSYNNKSTKAKKKSNLNHHGAADSSNDASFFREESHQG